MEEKDSLNNLRHSCAHLLAKAVLELWPGSHNAIGPAIENGFYQDFDMGEVKVSDADLLKIEEKMRELLPTWKQFTFNEISIEQARSLFKHNPYKIALAEEFAAGGKKLMTNDPGDFLDLCKMGHIENPSKELQNFKLLSIAGAYWRGDEKNKMLTRIYGTAFPTKEELEKYLWQLEEAKKRDHKKLGRELDLFLVSPEIGGGLPLFTPKGNLVRKLIEDYLIRIKQENGYSFVWTPHIANKAVYVKSKHWGKYDAMFRPMEIDDEEYVLKPMNCPHHFMIYLSRPRSYRDLPLRLAENGTVYRYEKSGELNGLLRVRAATIDDTHTFVISEPEQIKEELRNVIRLIKRVIEDFGFSKYSVRISTRDRMNDKYIGDHIVWSAAEEALTTVVCDEDMEYYVGEGEAAFYGPKIDFMIEDAIGREWQCSTVQLDFQQPENFDLTYTNSAGEEKKVAVLHIAVIGSIERFMGVLIEHYCGAFPLWLSPVQVAILPVSDKFASYAQEIAKKLEKDGIRIEIDDDNKTLGAKIRENTLQKIPYLCIIGEKEVGSRKNVSVRTREGKDLGMMGITEFLEKLKTEIGNKL